MVALLGEPGAGVAGGSRSTAILRIREILQDAQDYGVNRVAFNAAQRRDYARSRLDLEALQPVLKGQMPLAIQANRASDLLAAMRLARRVQDAARADRRVGRLDGRASSSPPRRCPSSSSR